MTPEARLDRLERIAKLFVRAALRYRRDLRALGDKIDIMVNAQIKNEELFKQNEKRFARFDGRFARNEERFARNEARVQMLSEKTDRRFVQLAESQANTDRNLSDLIELIRRSQNGNSTQNN